MPTTISQSHGEAEGDLIVYTLGPTGGSYDIKWAANKNAVSYTDNPARLILAGDSVFLAGEIDFTGAPTGGLSVVIGPELVPATYSQWPVLMWDDSAGVNKLGIAAVDPNANNILVFAFADGTTPAANDAVSLAGSFLRA
jgi:hypothetical protein